MTALTCSCCGKPVDAWVTLWTHQDVLICYECLEYLNCRRRQQIEERGGLEPLAGWDAVFSVGDISQAVDRYHQLGFTTEVHDSTYAFASWGNLVIQLALADDPNEFRTGQIYLHVNDADKLAARWHAAGKHVDDPENRDYGKREGGHIDPDGNIIRFGGPPR